MRHLPRVLVIDDEYGRSQDERNRDRESFCQRVGLKDGTGDVEARSLGTPVAEAVFLQGQREDDGRVENDLEGTLERVRQGWAEWPRWALLLLDLHFKTGPVGPGGIPQGADEDRAPHQYFGLTILEHLWADTELREIPVVILSSMDRTAIEERFSEHGVFDFFDKSNLNRRRLETLLNTYGLIEDDRREKEIVGHSLPLLKALREARIRARRGNDNILLLGETGTGKELLARYIHDKSGRAGNFITVSTQTTSENLIEDRLFGHEKGAFTGADKARPGAAELADEGTLFIDEFGNVPGTVQAKLLRLLDKNIRETQRQGSDETKQVDLQVVLATNKMEILKSEDFYKDLLARVKARNPITLPPLREREEDIPILAEYFVRKFEEKYDAKERKINDEALSALQEYPWPENVRELEAVIEEAVDRYRGLRRLSKTHLGLKDQKTHDTFSSITPARPRREEDLHSTDMPVAAAELDVNTLIQQLENGALREARRNELIGMLNPLARLMARLLNAALEVTRKVPSGDLSYTRAVKLITGNEEWGSTGAKRYIKKILDIAPEAIRPVLPELQALQALFNQQPEACPNDLKSVPEE